MFLVLPKTRSGKITSVEFLRKIEGDFSNFGIRQLINPDNRYKNSRKKK
jgi:hypothetical protein